MLDLRVESDSPFIPTEPHRIAASPASCSCEEAGILLRRWSKDGGKFTTARLRSLLDKRQGQRQRPPKYLGSKRQHCDVRSRPERIPRERDRRNGSGVL